MHCLSRHGLIPLGEWLYWTITTSAQQHWVVLFVLSVELWGVSHNEFLLIFSGHVIKLCVAWIVTTVFSSAPWGSSPLLTFYPIWLGKTTQKTSRVNTGLKLGNGSKHNEQTCCVSHWQMNFQEIQWMLILNLFFSIVVNIRLENHRMVALRCSCLRDAVFCVYMQVSVSEWMLNEKYNSEIILYSLKIQ